MIRKTVLILNVAIFGMMCYLVGNYQGVQEGRIRANSVDTAAIEYAVYQAMKGN